MKIVISDIPEKGLDISLDETIRTDYPVLLTPVKSNLHIDRMGHEILLKGNMSTSIELKCSRCLKEFKKDVDIDIDVVYLSTLRVKEETHEIKEDELDTGFYKNNEINLDELLLEQLILNIPMKPLCKESCRGICPRCGKDLNIEECNCETKLLDPRFEKLKKLLNNGKE